MNIDAWEAPAMGEFLKAADLTLVPKMRKAEVMVLLAPGAETDTKFAVELGLAVMLEKPIILLLIEDREAPDKVKALADEVVRVPEFKPAAVQMAVTVALSRMEVRGVVK